MRSLLALVSMVGAAAAAASDQVTIENGYRLRDGPGLKYEWHGRVFRRETKARIMGAQGPWRKVCVGGEPLTCKGGRSGWVYGAGIHRGFSEEARTAGCASGHCGPRPNRNEKNIEDIATEIDDNPRGYPLPSRPFAAACSNFINARGLGPWGARMIKTASTYAKDCFYDKNFFGKLCPNYLDLTTPKKNAVIAAMFATMAHVESSCNPNKSAVAYTDVGDGLFMMERSSRQRTRARRDPVLCEANNAHANTKSLVFQSNCTVSIIDQTICGSSEDANVINRHRNNYFAGWRGNGAITRTFRSTVRRWGLCY